MADPPAGGLFKAIVRQLADRFLVEGHFTNSPAGRSIVPVQHGGDQ